MLELVSIQRVYQRKRHLAQQMNDNLMPTSVDERTKVPRKLAYSWRQDGADPLKCLPLAIGLLAFAGSSGLAQSSRPDPHQTPGALNSAVTQETIYGTICAPRWTKATRPPEQLTQELKVAGYGRADRRVDHNEVDRLVPLSLGGAPADPRNLWWEAKHPPDGWGPEFKHELEDQLRYLVCAGQMPLATAQQAIRTDWIAAYQLYVGVRP